MTKERGSTPESVGPRCNAGIKSCPAYFEQINKQPMNRVEIDLTKILNKTTLDVLKDIICYSNCTYRDRQKRLNIALNSIFYQVDKLIDMGLVKKINRGKLITIVKQL